MIRQASLTMALGAALAGSAQAQIIAPNVPDFFKKSGISMYVGSGAGGGFDAYARVFVANFARHVPGNPLIVVKNMPGATGLVAMNYLANSAPTDGSALLASFNTIVMAHLYGDANAKFDPRKLGWIGSLGRATGTCLSWYTSPVKTLLDAQTRESLMGATGDGSTPVMYPKLLNAILGTKFKVISGYTTPGLRLAVENGEVEGVCGVTWETHMASVPYWILDRKVNFILQLGLREYSNLKGVPLALASISDPQDRKVFELLNMPLEFARPILAPPGVPDDRLEALRGAFAATMDDSAYLADANRAKQFPDPMSAKQALDLLNRAYESPKEVIARATVYAASGD